MTRTIGSGCDRSVGAVDAAGWAVVVDSRTRAAASRVVGRVGPTGPAAGIGRRAGPGLSVAARHESSQPRWHLVASRSDSSHAATPGTQDRRWRSRRRETIRDGWGRVAGVGETIRDEVGVVGWRACETIRDGLGSGGGGGETIRDGLERVGDGRARLRLGVGPRTSGDERRTAARDDDGFGRRLADADQRTLETPNGGSGAGLAGDGCGGGLDGGGVTEVGGRCHGEVVVELVLTGGAGRDVHVGDLRVRHVLEVLEQRTQ